MPWSQSNGGRDDRNVGVRGAELERVVTDDFALIARELLAMDGLPVYIESSAAPGDGHRIRDRFSTDDEICRVAWSSLGLTMTFANLGGADPCGPDGAIGSLDLVGTVAEQAGWITDDGGKIGMTSSELRQAYPEATRQGDTVSLIERPSPFGEGGKTTSLAACLGDGDALGYRVYVGAAGE